MTAKSFEFIAHKVLKQRREKVSGKEKKVNPLSLAPGFSRVFVGMSSIRAALAAFRAGAAQTVETVSSSAATQHPAEAGC